MDPQDDPLETSPAPERARFFAGQLLAPDLLRGEQTYHRGRLAILLRHLVGYGTIAGLRVIQPLPGQLEVAPGLALDAFGRLIELREPVCLDVSDWISDQDAFTYETALEAEPPAILGDVMLWTRNAPTGSQPGPDGPVASGIIETGQIGVVATWDADPSNGWPPADATDAEKLEAVLDAWTGGEAARPGLLLARITFPIDPDLPILVDNAVRPFIFLPGKWPAAADRP